MVKFARVLDELEKRSNRMLQWSTTLGSKSHSKFYADHVLSGIPFTLATTDFIGKRHTVKGFHDAMAFVGHRDLRRWALEAYTYVHGDTRTL